MGRYATFSTGIEYKFTFAVQCSSDMARFGGRQYTHFRTGPGDDEDHIIKWRKEDDVDIVWRALMSKAPESRSEEQVKAAVAAFPFTPEGTEQLRCSFYTDDWPANWLWSEPDLDNKTCAFLRLGCLIWHQLQYDEKLSVEYEHS